MNKFIIPLVFGAICATSTQALEKPKLSGFISQGYLISSDNPIYGIESDDSFDFREVAVNLSWQANDRLRFAGQVLSRRLGEFEDGSPELDFLLADFNFYLTENASAGIRAGRVKTPYGIYNTTRDVPHARPGVFVPQAVYFESFRDPLLSLDGANFYYDANFEFGDVTLDVYAGSSAIDSNGIEYQLYERDIPGNFDDADVIGAKVSFAPSLAPGLTLSATVLDAELALINTPVLGPLEQFAAFQALQMDPRNGFNYINSIDIDARLSLLSAQYSVGDVLLTTEFLEIDSTVSNLSILGQPQPGVSAPSSSYYAQVEWQASESLSLYSRVERLYYNSDDKDGREFALLVDGNAVNRFSKTITAGGRWYFDTSCSLTVEYSKNTGAAFLAGPDSIDYSSTKEDWDMFITTFSLHF